MSRYLGFALMLTLAALASAGAAPLADFYVAPAGNDAWSGRLPAPNAARSDGPFATVARAQKAVRGLRAGGAAKPVTVLLRGGTYRLTAPLAFTPEDSGSEGAPVLYAAYPGETPLLSGGRPITGWKRGRCKLWVAQIPEVKAGRWYFEQLWVNGRRATRARTPNRFYHYIERPAPAGTDPATGQPADLRNRAFIARREDIQPLFGLSGPALNDVNVVVYYAWESARLRPAAVDPETCRVVTTGPGTWKFGWLGRERYHLENSRAALDEPGEWYLDRDGTLFYWPRPGEEMPRAQGGVGRPEVVAPVVESFVQFQGDPSAGRPVEHLTLRGLAFEHAEYHLPAGGHSDGQAVVSLPAAVMADGCRNVTLEGCRVAHVGTYAAWFRKGCRECVVRRCWFEDLGAGGVRIGEAGIAPEDAARTHHVTCDNNIIHAGGRLFTGAVGVWIGQSSDNQVTHNDISDLFYTGVSVGWSWGYRDTDSKRNRIAFNHIHHLGHGVMSDMGGVYTLGNAEGTTVSDNVIHDIVSYNRYGYGGLGLYNDEGTTHITMENNLVYNTLDMTYHQHYGKENVIRNNILVGGENYQISVHRVEPHLSATFEKNIVWFKTGRLFWAQALEGRILAFNRNLYWDAAGRPIEFLGMPFAQWQASGQDKDSLIADPLFVDAARHDYRLRPDSPALKIGFQPFDFTRAGLTGDRDWTSLPKRFVYPAVQRAPDPPPPPPLVLNEEFEGTPVGAAPADGQVNLEGKGDAIAVTEETAAGGKRSLKFTDAPGLQYSFNPHLVLSPGHKAGTTRCSFDVRLEEGAELWHEYRDWSGNPYVTGPSLQIAGGKVKVRDRDLMDVPMGKWFHVEIAVPLGDKADDTWELAIALPGHEPRRFPGLPVVSPGWKQLTWIGFVSNAKEKSAFYLDNLKLESR